MKEHIQLKTIPIAKRNYNGKLITDLEEIKFLLEKEFTYRLRVRLVRPDLGDLECWRKENFELHLRLAEGI